MKHLLILILLAAVTLSAAPVAPVLSQTERGVEISVPLEAGTEPLSHQWYRETGTIKKKLTKIPSPEGTRPVFLIDVSSTPGIYTCEISNAAGKVVSRPVKVSFTTVPSAPSLHVTIKKP